MCAFHCNGWLLKYYIFAVCFLVLSEKALVMSSMLAVFDLHGLGMVAFLLLDDGGLATADFVICGCSWIFE